METFATPITVAAVAALVGDPARAAMMSALLGGQPLTASELAWHAGVSASTASEHLAKLAEGGLVAPERQGRHRYFRLASPLVAQMLESIMAVATIQGPPRHRPRLRIDDAMATARTCYDHLAGRLGVGLADALSARRCIEWSTDGGVVTRAGERFLAGFGVDLAQARERRRAFCRPCLDWSERRPHIAGALGAEIAGRCFALGWIRRMKDTRALVVTADGAAGLRETFGIALRNGGR